MVHRRKRHGEPDVQTADESRLSEPDVPTANVKRLRRFNMQKPDRTWVRGPDVKTANKKQLRDHNIQKANGKQPSVDIQTADGTPDWLVPPYSGAEMSPVWKRLPEDVLVNIIEHAGSSRERKAWVVATELFGPDSRRKLNFILHRTALNEYFRLLAVSWLNIYRDIEDRFDEWGAVKGDADVRTFGFSTVMIGRPHPSPRAEQNADFEYLPRRCRLTP